MEDWYNLFCFSFGEALALHRRLGALLHKLVGLGISIYSGFGAFLFLSFRSGDVEMRCRCIGKEVDLLEYA